MQADFASNIVTGVSTLFPGLGGSLAPMVSSRSAAGTSCGLTAGSPVPETSTPETSTPETSTPETSAKNRRIMGLQRQNQPTLSKLGDNIRSADLDPNRTFGTLPASCGEPSGSAELLMRVLRGLDWSPKRLQHGW